MSQKRTMTKRERLYHEYNNKEKVKEELIELSRNVREYEEKVTTSSFDPVKTGNREKPVR